MSSRHTECLFGSQFKTQLWHLFTFGVMVCNVKMLYAFSQKIKEVKYCILQIYEHVKTLKHVKAKPCVLSTQSNTDPSETEYIHVRYYDELKCDLFSGMKALDLCYDKQIVKLDEDMSIEDSLCQLHNSRITLHDSRITCALVMSYSNHCIGVLDTPDMIRYVLNPHSKRQNVKSVLRRCVIADSDAPINDIIIHLRNGMRYIAITGDDNVQLVSQGAVLRRIVSHTSSFISDIMETTIHNLQLGQRVPIHCKNTETAGNAFETMIAYGITSLPIINEDGFAQGVISATDIFYARENTTHLTLPVLDYVSESRAESNISRKANCIVSCQRDDSLGTVLRIMMHESVHHVYVIEDGKPCGVISFVDILKIL